MSFGYGISDGITLIQLAWRTVEGARKACGEHDDLTKEVSSLHLVLEQLQSETTNSNSLINLADENRRDELRKHVTGCEHHLRHLGLILEKYNALSNEERSGKKLWQRFRFGNGEVLELADIRLKISTYTMAISMSLHLLSLGSQGRVERQLGRQGGDLQGIRESVNWLVAKLNASSREGSIMTSYPNDDKAFWRSLRRELVEDGYSSRVIHDHKRLIQGYVKELGARGVLDDGMRCSRISLASAPHSQTDAERDLIDTVENAKSSTESLDVGQSPAVQKIVLAEPNLFDPNSATISVESIQSSVQQEIGVSLEEITDEEFLKVPGWEATLPVFGAPAQANTTGNGASIHDEEVLVSLEMPADKPGVLKPHKQTTDTLSSANEVIGRVNNVRQNVETTHVPVLDDLYNTSNPENLTGIVTRAIDILDLEESTKAAIEKIKADAAVEIEKLKKDSAQALVEGIMEQRRKEKLLFKAADGRKFSFPFHLCATWGGMEELIRQAFLHVDVLGPRVAEGRYDLIGPNGEIILPQAWESMIEPDWDITMHMWPSPEPRKLPPGHLFGYHFNRPRNRHESSHRSSPPGMPPPPPAPYRNSSMSGPPPPPPPSQRPGGPYSLSRPPISAPGPGVRFILSHPPPSKKKTEPAKGVLGWMSGKGNMVDKSSKKS